ncbi:MAG: hypothetical protein H7325_10095 [Pedobacter sp.]|nr:hypothetical protein [Pedobacter sp.]
MKTFHFLLLLVCIAFLGCEKQDLSQASDAAKQSRILDTQLVPVTSGLLDGMWELRHILGVQVKDAPSDFGLGNGYIVTFDGNNYKKTENGKVIDSGTYTLEKKHSGVDFEEYEDIMILNSDAYKENLEYNWRVCIKMSNDRVMMAYGSVAVDGFTTTHQRLNPDR